MLSHYSNLSYLEGLAPKEINLNEYTLAQERNDERFGLIFFMRSKSSTRTIFVKDRSKALTEEHSREISARVRITNDYLLKIYGIKQVPQSDTFQIYFEDFSQDLHSEISRHVSQGTRFAEAELYAILYSAVSGLEALQQNNISHDFMVPMNILKFSKDLYKLHDNFIISPKSYLYTQALRGNYQRYLAPELFESLSQKKEKPDAYDPYKADIFALGMCILDAGLLNTSGDFINRKLMILDERAIERALKKFGDVYSNAMVQILEDMLFPDPSKRPSPSTLLRRLPGKPLVKGQALSGKKRKPLDRAIIASPERIFQQARSRSPRISAGEEPKRSYLPTQDFTSLGRTSMMRGSYSPDNLTVHQPTRQSPIRDRIADLARINVSTNIKNDPVLSQFLKRLHPEPIPIIEALSKSPINDRNLAKSIDPINIPHTAQFPTREVEVRSIPAQKPFAETMKPAYISSLLSPIHGDERAFTQTYKSGLLASAPGLETRLKDDQGPLKTYHLESLKNGAEARQIYLSPPGGLGHYNGTTTNFPRTPQSDSKKDNTINLESGSKPKSKIDELIAKAMERSSTNLFLSQQVSAEIHSNIDVEPFRSSYHSTSSQPHALKTILERPGSEGYLTPLVSEAPGRFGGSSLVDLVNSRK